MGRDATHYSKLLRALSNLALNTSRYGASMASLGNLFQYHHCHLSDDSE